MLPMMAASVFLWQEGGVDVGRATAEGTRILTAFGVPRPYHLRFSSEKGAYRLKTVSLAVTAGDGKGYGIHMDRRTGRCLLVRRDDTAYERNTDPRPNRPMGLAVQQAKVERALRQLGWPSEPPYLCQPLGTTDEIQAPFFVDGYPFVHHSWYDYHVRLDAANGAFREYARLKAAPEVEHTSPMVTADGALESARRILVSDPKQTYDPGTRTMKAWREYKVPASKFEAGPKLRLAWFVPYQHLRARLVWEVPYLSLHDSENELNPMGYEQTLYVDAVTGEHVPPPPGRL